jgi:hypothetical protein
MGTQIIFCCDHINCDASFHLDSTSEDPGTLVPLNLGPVVHFLTDDPPRGPGWEFALDKMGDLLIVRKLFCPEHGDDIKLMPEYMPDAVAVKHARREKVK